MKQLFNYPKALSIAVLILIGSGIACLQVWRVSPALPAPILNARAKYVSFPSPCGSIDVHLLRDYSRNSFWVSVANRGSLPIHIVTYNLFYEVRLFDKDGNELTDERAYEQITKFRMPSSEDVVTLLPGEKHLVSVDAHKPHGVMHPPPEAVYVDCILRHPSVQDFKSGKTWDALEPTSDIVTPVISLRSP